MSRRKRQRIDLSLLSTVGFDATDINKLVEDPLESCLAEFGASTTKPAEDPLTKEERKSNTTQVLSEESPLRESSSRPHSLKKSCASIIKEWSIAFVRAGKRASSRGLLPSFDFELSRHFHVQELSTFLLELDRNLRMPLFERWLIDSKVEEKTSDCAVGYVDPILSQVSPESSSCQRLVRELVDAGIDNKEASRAVKELCQRTVVALADLKAKKDQQWSGFRKGDRIELEKTDNFYSLVYHRQRWKKPFRVKITKYHYQKLKALFISSHNQEGWVDLKIEDASGKSTRALHAFHLILMVLLLRYSSLSGGQLLKDLRGGGMQGAVHSQLFDVLNGFFPQDEILECCASPLNSHLSTFGSAFSEIDFHFGSIGSVFDFDVTSGVCEVNPPFSPAFMDAVVDRIERNLSLANKSNKSLTFCIIVPTVASTTSKGPKDTVKAAHRFAQSSFLRMIEAEACRHHIVLPAREHGYIEGAQHLRPTRYKESSYDTSVILLQSKAARTTSLDLVAWEREIRSAFASQHKEELKSRRGDA